MKSIMPIMLENTLKNTLRRTRNLKQMPVRRHGVNAQRRNAQMHSQSRLRSSVNGTKKKKRNARKKKSANVRRN
jgi:hypothetical protein